LGTERGFFRQGTQDKTKRKIGLRCRMLTRYRLQRTQVGNHRFNVFTVQLPEIVIRHHREYRLAVALYPRGNQPKQLAVRPVAYPIRGNISRNKLPREAHLLVKYITAHKFRSRYWRS